MDKNRHIDQWDRVKDTEINQHRDSYLNLDKDVKNICWRRKKAFLTSGAGKTGYPYCR